jgi:spore germination protein KC
VINPKSLASKKSTNEAPVVLYAETGKDLFEIKRKMTTKSPRKIYNSHLRMVVLGEEVAKEGVGDIIDFFARNHEYRTDYYFVVAKGVSAHALLSSLTPTESIPGMEMFDSLKTSEENWAPTKSMRIIEMANSIIADGKNPVLSGIEIMGGDIEAKTTDTLKHSDDIEKPTYTGLAVFKKDKLAGWLDQDESKGYNYITGNVKNTVGYVEYSDNVKVTFEITKAESDIKPSMVNGKPVIDVIIKIRQNVGAVSGEFDVSKQENIDILTGLAEEKLKSMCQKVIKKAKTEYKSDIFGFGEAIHRKYPKYWKTVKDNWNNEFEKLTVNVTVETKTIQLGQITKPLLIKGKE